MKINDEIVFEEFENIKWRIIKEFEFKSHYYYLITPSDNLHNNMIVNEDSSIIIMDIDRNSSDREILENIKLEFFKDMGREFKLKINKKYYKFITYKIDKTEKEIYAYLCGIKECFDFKNHNLNYKINFLNEKLRKFIDDGSISLTLIEDNFINLELEF